MHIKDHQRQLYIASRWVLEFQQKKSKISLKKQISLLSPSTHVVIEYHLLLFKYIVFEHYNHRHGVLKTKKNKGVQDEQHEFTNLFY